jgi:hypothetical protein
MKEYIKPPSPEYRGGGYLERVFEIAEYAFEP